MSKLGSLLVREGLLTESDRRTIRRESSSHRGSFVRSVLALGVVDQDELASLFATKTAFKVAPKNLAGEVDGGCVGSVPASVLQWFDAIPIQKKNGVLSVAMVDPTDREVILQLEFFSGLKVRPVIAPLRAIREAIDQHLLGKIEFGRSEFEEFLGNHSGDASRVDRLHTSEHEVVEFQEDTNAWGASSPQSQKYGEAQQSQESYDSSGGSEVFELLSDESDSPAAKEPQAAAPLVPAALDDFSDAALDTAAQVDDDLVDDAAAHASMLVDPFSEEDPVSTGAGSQETVNLEPVGDVDLTGLDDGLEVGSRHSNELEGLGAEEQTAQPEDPFEPVSGEADGLDLLGSEANEPLSLADSLSEGAVAEPIVDTGLDVSLDADFATDTPSANSATDLADMNISEPVEIEAPMEASTSGSGLEAAQTDDSFEADIETLGVPELDGELLAAEGTESPLTEEISPILEDDSKQVDSDDTSLELDPFDTDDIMISGASDTTTIADLSPNDIGSEFGGGMSLSDIDIEGDSSSETPALGNLRAVDREPNGSEDDLLDPVIDAEASATDAPSPAVAAQAHDGIANLNRALVNLALLTDAKKALIRLAEAATQVGIPSGAVMRLAGDNLKPGILWSQEASRLGSIHDVPAGLSGKALSSVVDRIAKEEKWCAVEDVLGGEAVKLKSAWPASENQPTHIYCRSAGDGYVVAFAHFAGEANHGGLQEIFGELVRAAGVKIKD